MAMLERVWLHSPPDVLLDLYDHRLELLTAQAGSPSSMNCACAYASNKDATARPMSFIFARPYTSVAGDK